MRRRMRFRCTAPPKAFLTLIPNRLMELGPRMSFTVALALTWLTAGSRPEGSH